MPACIQVCPVEIPGRGRREGEPALTDAAELARVLAHALPLQASHMLHLLLFSSSLVASLLPRDVTFPGLSHTCKVAVTGNTLKGED